MKEVEENRRRKVPNFSPLYPLSLSPPSPHSNLSSSPPHFLYFPHPLHTFPSQSFSLSPLIHSLFSTLPTIFLPLSLPLPIHLPLFIPSSLSSPLYPPLPPHSSHNPRTCPFTLPFLLPSHYLLSPPFFTSPSNLRHYSLPTSSPLPACHLPGKKISIRRGFFFLGGGQGDSAA